MAKTTVTKPVESKPDVLGDVKGYARKIWLAGLGAYTKAGQDSADMFKDLVKAGQGLEQQGKKLVNDQVDAATSQIDSVKSSVNGVKEKVEVQLDRIEHGFDSRVAKALHRLGIPAKQDINELSAKLDELSVMLEQATRNK